MAEYTIKHFTFGGKAINNINGKKVKNIYYNGNIYHIPESATTYSLLDIIPVESALVDGLPAYFIVKDINTEEFIYTSGDKGALKAYPAENANEYNELVKQGIESIYTAWVEAEEVYNVMPGIEEIIKDCKLENSFDNPPVTWELFNKYPTTPIAFIQINDPNIIQSLKIPDAVLNIKFSFPVNPGYLPCFILCDPEGILEPIFLYDYQGFEDGSTCTIEDDGVTIAASIPAEYIKNNGFYIVAFELN